MKIGDSVVYHDEVGRPHNALLTAVWGSDDKCLTNLLYISSDETKTDSYGRQMERQSSCQHVSTSNVHGRYWRKHDEKPNPIMEPVQK